MGASYLARQAIWAVVGVAAFALAATVNYDTLQKWAIPLLVVSCVLLAAVYLPHVGYVAGNARRWIGTRAIRFQPSELAKVALILGLAAYCQRQKHRLPTLRWGILVPGCILAPVLGLILLEPDRGTALLMLAVCAVMLFVGGASWKYCLSLLVPGAAVGAIYFARDPLVILRLKAWWFLEESKMDKGYQAYQSMLAFARGGVFGLGLGNGRQKLGFVPEHHTDMILSIMGEELGLLGTLAVLLLFAAVVGCGLVIAHKARDPFGALAATGITTLIGLQTLINIGVVTSALPCKGLPLPFISYGGSNLVMMLGCIGLLINFARQAQGQESLTERAFDDLEMPEPQTP